MGAKRIPWIVNDTELVMRHPFKLSGVKAFSFALPSSFRKLKGLVDATLNPAGETTYYPFAPIVLATFLRSDHVISLHPEDQLKGRLREKELSFAIPLLAFLNDREPETPLFQIVWYMPALWLDCPTALTAGREVYGYPKQLGKIEMPRKVGPNESAQFAAFAHVIRSYNTNECADIHLIVNVTRTDGDRALRAAFATRFREVLQDAFSRSFQSDLDFFGLNDLAMRGINWARRRLLEDLRDQNLLKLVFLKQFPAVETSRESCYQAVVETPFHINEFRKGGFLEGNYQLRFPSYDSLCLPGIFGIDVCRLADGSFATDAQFGIFADFDFTLESGETIQIRR